MVTAHIIFDNQQVIENPLTFLILKSPAKFNGDKYNSCYVLWTETISYNSLHWYYCKRSILPVIDCATNIASALAFFATKQQRPRGSVPRAASADALISDVSGAERGSVDNERGRIDTRYLPADNDIVGCDAQVIHRSYNGSQTSLRAARGWWIRWDVWGRGWCCRRGRGGKIGREGSWGRWSSSRYLTRRRGRYYHSSGVPHRVVVYLPPWGVGQPSTWPYGFIGHGILPCSYGRRDVREAFVDAPRERLDLRRCRTPNWSE